MTGTERKVFQKYYPPDFDPSKIPRAKLPFNRQFVQRVMAPFNMQCNTCGEYIYKGKKFNMRRETAEGEAYLGLRIFRFYFRCPNCLAEITFKTDLEKCDYANEHGATRLFEATRLLQEQEKEIEKQEEEDKTNPMKMLEKRTKMSRAEMEALGKLEELQELNRRQGKVNYEGMLQEYQKQEAESLKRQEEEDERFVQSIFGPRRLVKVEEDEGGGSDEGEGQGPSTSGGPVRTKRLLEDSDEEADSDSLPTFSGKTKEMKDFSNEPIFAVKPKNPEKRAKLVPAVSSQKKLLSGIVVANKKKQEEKGSGVDQPSSGFQVAEVIKDDNSIVDKPASSGSAGLGLIGGYGSSESSSGPDSA